MKPITFEQMRAFVDTLAKEASPFGIVDAQAYQRIGQLEEMLRTVLNEPRFYRKHYIQRIKGAK